jgi:hypothetical protein
VDLRHSADEEIARWSFSTVQDRFGYEAGA